MVAMFYFANWPYTTIMTHTLRNAEECVFLFYGSAPQLGKEIQKSSSFPTNQPIVLCLCSNYASTTMSWILTNVLVI